MALIITIILSKITDLDFKNEVAARKNLYFTVKLSKDVGRRECPCSCKGFSNISIDNNLK